LFFHIISYYYNMTAVMSINRAPDTTNNLSQLLVGGAVVVPGIVVVPALVVLDGEVVVVFEVVDAGVVPPAAVVPPGAGLVAAGVVP
jgi:hypothetical protein